MILDFIVWLIVGAIAGWLARLIVKGYGFGIGGNIAVGIVGALIAGWLLPRLGVFIGGGLIAAIITAVIGAVILLLIIGLINARAGVATPGQRKRPTPQIGEVFSRFLISVLYVGKAMSKPIILGQTAFVLAAWISHVADSHAFDLTGLWASDPSACAKIFAQKGDRTSMRKDSDIHGSGLIIERNRIRGRTATCKIRSTKQDGSVMHLMTTCATDVMLSNVQLSVKIIDDNKISRIFPGMENIEFDYFRCAARPGGR